MAVSSIAARRAYGIGTTPVIPQEKQIVTSNSTPLEPSVAQGVARAQSVASSARSSEAAATLAFKSSSDKAVEKNPPQNVKSILSADDDDVTPLPARAEVEGYARRYIKVISQNGARDVTDEEVQKLTDFYGASSDRATRLQQLVQELERGQDGSAQNGAVAVA